MGNVFRVLRRDYARLFKAPAALIVALVLVALPSLYTWFNVVGFWNPYNNTGNMRVCVVNQDEGAYTDVTGQLRVGDQIVGELESNTQLGWVFTDYDTAMEEVQSGKSYAAFVIPSDFSEDLTTLLTGDFKQPQLQYYVNEKMGAVSPKVTDTGGTMLDETINSTFVSTVSGIVADQLDAGLAESENRLSTSKSNVAVQAAKAKAGIGDARAAVASLSAAADGAVAKTDEAKASLRDAKGYISALGNQQSQVADLTVKTQNQLNRFSTSFMSAMDKSSVLTSQAVAKTNTSIGSAAAAAVAAQGDVDAAIKAGQAAADQNDAVIKQLQSLQQSLPDGDSSKELAGQIIESLQAQNASLKQSLSDMKTISADTSATAQSIATASNAVSAAAQGALDSADAYRGTLSSTTLPTVNSGLSQLSTTANSLATAISNQTILIDQATAVVDQMTATLKDTSSALGETDSLLSSLQTSLDTVQTDLAALGTSNALADLIGGDGTIDVEKVADFMFSPTQLTTHTLYPLNAYGSAMAPLFTNLTLWIGVFMLMVILKQEVDDEGIKNLTIAQRYWARWLFLAPLAALQAVVCCAGNLFIGVQTVNVTLYFLTAIMASLTYLSIQYALSVTLQHIGKGICVILVFVQIPGATGLYPIEMTNDFFQAVYPLFPFTYGINAMRETIAGFYDGHWTQMVSILGMFSVVSFLVGLIVRPYLTNLNRMFAKQVRESDILNGEDVQVPVQRFRLEQLIRALSDKEEYRKSFRCMSCASSNGTHASNTAHGCSGLSCPLLPRSSSAKAKRWSC